MEHQPALMLNCFLKQRLGVNYYFLGSRKRAFLRKTKLRLASRFKARRSMCTDRSAWKQVFEKRRFLREPK